MAEFPSYCFSDFINSHKWSGFMAEEPCTHRHPMKACRNQSSVMAFAAPRLGAAGGEHVASSISGPQIPQAVVWSVNPHKGQSASQWVGAPGMAGSGGQQEQSEEKRVIWGSEKSVSTGKKVGIIVMRSQEGQRLGNKSQDCYLLAG